MKTTFDTLRDILARDYEVAPELLKPDTPLTDIDIDSLAVMELIFALEDKFGVTAEMTEDDFNTVGDIGNYIDRLIAEREAGPDGGSATASGAATRE